MPIYRHICDEWGLIYIKSDVVVSIWIGMEMRRTLVGFIEFLILENAPNPGGGNY
ncbi:hypothetical protein KDW_37880 [Dictyobacter vulcani]|uniref:Uncharacterized protein n=1 Tax=Dictyobacter vulcani TaxID=2607529 RepID=A0A5J4KWN8_9CHLR|nr:hypothetical protein KDW_37880 [Dictyobacter vulcani]